MKPQQPAHGLLSSCVVAVAQHRALFPCAYALVRYTALAMFNLVLLCPQLSAIVFESC